MRGKDPIQLEYVVAVNPANSGLRMMAECIPGANLRQVEGPEDIPPIAEEIAQPSGDQVAVTFAPGAVPIDGLGRAVRPEGGRLTVSPISGSSRGGESVSLTRDPVTVTRGVGTRVGYRFEPGLGPPVEGEVTFTDGVAAPDLAWSLPRLTVTLLTANGTPVSAPVTWTVDALDSPPASRSFDGENVLSLDLLPGRYSVTAAVPEQEAARLDVTLGIGGSDPVLQFAPPAGSAPGAGERIRTTTHLRLGAPTLAMGSEPIVEVVWSEGQETVRAGGLISEADLRGDRDYRLQVFVNATEAYSRAVPLAGQGGPLELFVDLAPGRVFAEAAEPGIWTVERLDQRARARLAGRVLDQTVAPGRYRVLYEDRPVCTGAAEVVVAAGSLIDFGPIDPDNTGACP